MTIPLGRALSGQLSATGELSMRFLQGVFHRPGGSEASQPSVALTRTRDARSNARIPIKCWVSILYFDAQHIKKLLPGRVVDMSGSGLAVESIGPLEEGTVVFVRSKSTNLLSGSACVRHCARRGLKYRIGLQYGVPMKNRF